MELVASRQSLATSIVGTTILFLTYTFKAGNKIYRAEKIDGGPASLRREGDHLLICYLINNIPSEPLYELFL